MIQNSIQQTTEAVLKKHLAPDVAKQLAQDVATASTGVIESEVTKAVTAAVVSVLGGHLAKAPKAKTKGAAKTKVSAVAPAAAKPKAAAAAKTGSTRVLSAEARKKMSFKKTLFHATRRAKLKKPEPWDAAILQADAEGKIISVEHAKKLAGASTKAPKKTAKRKKTAAAVAVAAAPKKRAKTKAKAKRARTKAAAAAAAEPASVTPITKKAANGHAAVAADAPF